jgi:hypothetical protein
LTVIQKKYNVSERTARYDLSELAEKNLIGKQGEKKQTKYIFADKLPFRFRYGLPVVVLRFGKRLVHFINRNLTYR